MVIFMKFIQGNYEKTTIIQKSKFIAEAYRVNSVEEIDVILTNIRKNTMMPHIIALPTD